MTVVFSGNPSSESAASAQNLSEKLEETIEKVCAEYSLHLVTNLVDCVAGGRTRRVTSSA